MDTFQGQVDVTFVRLQQTDAQIAARGDLALEAIDPEITAAGFTAPGKIYSIYYDGSNPAVCGNAKWPPLWPGKTAAFYLRGTPQGGNCFSQGWPPPGGQPNYTTFAMLHDTIHTTGIVGRCAPHHYEGNPGHVTDSSTDLHVRRASTLVRVRAGPGPRRLLRRTHSGVPGPRHERLHDDRCRLRFDRRQGGERDRDSQERLVPAHRLRAILLRDLWARHGRDPRCHVGRRFDIRRLERRVFGHSPMCGDDGCCEARVRPVRRSTTSAAASAPARCAQMPRAEGRRQTSADCPVANPTRGLQSRPSASCPVKTSEGVGASAVAAGRPPG